MAGEKIDSLTLDIGLTSDEFQAGVNKILGAMDQMAGKAEEAGEGMGASFASMGSSVASLAMRFAGMFLAFKGVEGLVDYFKDLSASLADVGFAGKYLGQSAVELRRFGELAELSGGKAQDAISAVRGLNAAIFGLEYEGQVSQGLTLLSRLNVTYLNPDGSPRDSKSLAFDAAQKLHAMLPEKITAAGVDVNQAMRTEFAAHIFGAGGIANAIAGPLKEFETNYAKSSRDNKDITQKLIDSQIKLQQATTSLKFEMQDVVATALSDMTPTILDLINTIENEWIPVIKELIGDIMDLTHPGRMIQKVDEKLGLGPNNPLTHPLNFLRWSLGMAPGEFDSLKKNLATYKVESTRIPSDVMPRLAPDTNLDALKLLHEAAGGDQTDPTWSKTILAYRSLAATPGAPEALVNEAFFHGPPPPVPNPHQLSTPSAQRPASPVPGGSASKPTASTMGPGVSIGQVGPIYTQATDANGIMADASRAARRKFLVALSDPGMA